MADIQWRGGIPLDGPRRKRPRNARRWVLDRCTDLNLEPAGVDVPLLVSELVTNACVHGGDPVILRLEVGHTRMRIEVEDSVSHWPELQWPDERDVHGRGLLIVELLSCDWDTENTPTGKVVWAEVPIRDAGADELEQVGCG